MNIKELLKDWETHSYRTEDTSDICIKLPFEIMERIIALDEMFPGRNTEQIIMDLHGLTLNEI